VQSARTPAQRQLIAFPLKRSAVSTGTWLTFVNFTHKNHSGLWSLCKVHFEQELLPAVSESRAADNPTDRTSCFVGSQNVKLPISDIALLSALREIYTLNSFFPLAAKYCIFIYVHTNKQAGRLLVKSLTL
jgi:hypothetical protein